MLESVLMRVFLMLYASDFEGDDDRSLYKSGKSGDSESRAFTLLSSVCWCWRQTLVGWPQSSTPRWFRHKLKKLIERECILLSLLYSVLLLSLGNHSVAR